MQFRVVTLNLEREADVQRLLDDGINADLRERSNAIVAASAALSATPIAGTVGLGKFHSRDRLLGRPVGPGA